MGDFMLAISFLKHSKKIEGFSHQCMLVLGSL
jgi:hypothetical protein